MEEQQVFDLVETSEYYKVYHQVNMEDAVNVFFAKDELGFPDWLERNSLWKNSGTLRFLASHGGTSKDDPRQCLFLDFEKVRNMVSSALADPKVKSVPFHLPFGYDRLMEANVSAKDENLPFKYSASKKAFIRQLPPKEKTKLGKAPFNDMKRHVGYRVVSHLKIKYQFTNVTVSTTTSSREMDNAVVLLKTLGIKTIEQAYDIGYLDWSRDNGCYEKKDGISFKEHLDEMANEYHLSDKLKKDLAQTVKDWWKNCKEPA